MRHANISTTLDFYANLDEAVERPILGEQHNRLHNTGGCREQGGGRPVDTSANPGPYFD
jgi:hypothetical protein